MFVADNAKPRDTDYDSTRLYPVPKSGNRRARISMIVDLGIQERAPVWEKGGKMVKEGTEGAVMKELDPCRQVAVFADLVNDVVDYGGDIGKQHYRLLFNPTFKGVLKGIVFKKTPPQTDGGEWGMHPNNVLTKIANAVGKPEVVQSTDISQLLGEQLMVMVEVKETPSGKKDKDGNEIVYRNVNYKSCSAVAPEIKTDEDGNEEEVMPTFAALKMTPKAVTFTNATKEDIKVIRSNIIKQIKLASDYAGSEMQKAIEAFEAEQANKQQDTPAEGKVAPTPKPAAKPKAEPAKKPVDTSDMDDDVPF